MTDLEKLELALYRIRDAEEPPRDPIELVEALINELTKFTDRKSGTEDVNQMYGVTAREAEERWGKP